MLKIKYVEGHNPHIGLFNEGVEIQGVERIEVRERGYLIEVISQDIIVDGRVVSHKELSNVKHDYEDESGQITE